ncbi:hypothetical protein [Erwinia tracheiphila]
MSIKQGNTEMRARLAYEPRK